MKPKFILLPIVLLFTFTELRAEKPLPLNYTLKEKHRFFISTYISALLSNDISIACEHNYKRFRQELGFLYKSLHVRKDYLFESGQGLNYHVKYNFILRNSFLMSADLGYIYRKAHYTDKVDAMAYNFYPNEILPTASFYRMDKKNTYSGISFGISSLTRIYKRFLFGFNVYLNFGRAHQLAVAREYISGEVLKSPTTTVSLPIAIETRTWRFGATGLFKIVCQI